jgi:hypothetical protein
MAWLGKEFRPLYAASPWADDPYDAFVSFAIFFVPLLTTLIVVRLPMSRRAFPLDLARTSDLLRTSRLLMLIVGATLASEWVALVATMPSIVWSLAAAVDVAMLCGLTLAAVHVARLLLTAPSIPAASVPTETPDALTDAVTSARLLAARLGPGRTLADSVVDRVNHWLVRPSRAHPTTAAGLVAAAFGVAVATAAFVEDGLAPVLFIYLFVGAAAMFAFVAIGGGYLHVVRPQKPLTGARARVRNALVAGAAAMPFALAFRNLIWPIVGINPADTGPSDLVVLVVAVSAIAFVAFLAVEWLARR